MPFLTINGLAIDIAADGAVQADSYTVGESRRMFDATLRSTVRATKRIWTMTSPVLTIAEEAALRALVANAATVSLSGDCVNNVAVPVIVTIGSNAFVMDGLTFRRAPTMTIEEV